jgi:3-deoxy-D-manno-octulosonic-acid transferase
METEIWFNLIHACYKFGTPLLLLNARMSEKSARGYARFERLTHNALGELTAIAAQTADDAARLTRLGAHNVSIMGNLKFDIEPPRAMLELGKQLREQLGKSRKIFLAASTREGEEVLLLDALKNIHIPNLLLVIVPRHPQRFADIANLLEQRGIPFQRRSKNCAVRPEIQVVLGDSMGEMFAYYAAADLSFIGGSLLPYGGQNLIEACSVGTPVLVGPYTHNFAEATRLAIHVGAAELVQDAREMITKLQLLLDDPKALCEMRQQCINFVEFNRGATDKSLQIIKGLLSNKSER